MNNINFASVGRFIQFLRKERELTVENIANCIGVTKSAVSQWEHGNGIKPEMLYVLARFFDVSVDELVAGKRDDEFYNDFVKRNYDLSLYEFDEKVSDDKSGGEYFSCLERIKNRFFSLLKKKVIKKEPKRSEEEFAFLRRYFQRDDVYLAYLQYGPEDGRFLNDSEAQEIIENHMLHLSSKDDKAIDWELQKFYSLKTDCFKIELVLQTESNHLLGRLLSIMTQPEKDGLLATQLNNVEKDKAHSGLRIQETKTESNSIIDEIEKKPYFKTMLNGGCNCMKTFEIPSRLEKEDLNHLDGDVIGFEEIPLNDGVMPYAGNFTGLLSPWKMYSYEEYSLLLDAKKTEYYKALVNFKNNDPLSYFDALKKYYEGE